MKKNKVWLGQVKDVPTIKTNDIKKIVSKLDKYTQNHPDENIEGFLINGGKDTEAISRGAKKMLDELNDKGHHNIIFISDQDGEMQMQNLKNRITNKNNNKNKR
jgi:hypothetical protein